MNITVFGASGRTGQALLRHAHTFGHQVTAHVRDPARLAGAPAHAVVTGSVFDPDSAAEAVHHADAVIIALGLHRNRSTPLYSRGTRTIVDAMHKQGTDRLLVVSEAAYRPHTRGAVATAAATVYGLLNSPAIRERREQDIIVTTSRTCWTILRPTLLTHTVPRRIECRRPAPRPHAGTFSRTTYTELARHIIDILDDPRTFHRNLYL